MILSPVFPSNKEFRSLLTNYLGQKGEQYWSDIYITTSLWFCCISHFTLWPVNVSWCPEKSWHAACRSLNPVRAPWVKKGLRVGMDLPSSQAHCKAFFVWWAISLPLLSKGNGSLGLPDFKIQDRHVCPEASLCFCYHSSLPHPTSLWAAVVAEATLPEAASVL